MEISINDIYNQYNQSSNVLNSNELYKSFNKTKTDQGSSSHNIEAIETDKILLNLNNDINNKNENFDKIDKLFKLPNEKNEKENNKYNNDLDSLNLSNINNNNNNEDDNFEVSGFEEEFIRKNNKSLLKCLNYYKTFNYIEHKKIFQNSYFRLIFLKEENQNQKNEIKNMYIIPIIKCERYQLIFKYENYTNILDMDEILNLILQNNLFIKNEEENKNILEQTYNCEIHNKKYITYCECRKNLCELCLKEEHSTHKQLLNNDISECKINKFKSKVKSLKYKYLKVFINYRYKIKDLVKELNNKNNSDNFKEQIKLKADSMFRPIKELFNMIIYFSIINNLIEEKLNLLNEKYNYNIVQNIIGFHNYYKSLKKYEKKKNNKRMEKIINEKYNKNIITSIIPFYSDKGKNSNIYIGVNSNGYVIIISFNFKNKNDELNNNIDNNSVFGFNNNIKEINYYYNIINLKKLNLSFPQKIMKLEKYYQKYSKNIFLISFSSINEKGDSEAKLIEISNDYKNIVELKSIMLYKGLLNPIEINYNNNYYYLNSTKKIILWDYDYNKNEFEYKEIIPKESNINNKEKIDYNNLRSYKEMIYVKKRNLLIIQYTFHKPDIYFFSITTENNEFSLIFIDRVTIKTENLYFSNYRNNSCVIKDKYLLIGTKIDKQFLKEKRKNENKDIKEINKINEEKISGGFYIIDLDNYKDFKIQYIDNCKNVFCISNIRENIFVCSISFSHVKNYKHKNYELITFEILEDNNKIVLNKIYYKQGDYKEINSSEMINDNFIICSCNKKNQIVKIDEYGIIFPYFDIYSIK